MALYAVLLVGPDDPRGRPVGSVDSSLLLRAGDVCPPNRIEMDEVALEELHAEFSSAVALSVAAERLARTKEHCIHRLKYDVTRNVIEARYSDAQQRSLMMLYQEAQVLGYVNRVALIQMAIDWIKSVLHHYYLKRDEVLAAPDSAAVDAVVVDLASLAAADPQVSLEDVIALNN